MVDCPEPKYSRVRNLPDPRYVAIDTSKVSGHTQTAEEIQIGEIVRLVSLR